VAYRYKVIGSKKITPEAKKKEELALLFFERKSWPAKELF